MHKLDRDNTAAPPCLSGYHHTTHSWDNFGSKCKKQLRAALVKMQGIPGVTTEDASEYGVRCAYCEDAIHHAGHIEHFRRKNKNHFPELTFDWSNLFLACGSKNHCGHYKDRSRANPYNPDELIKPDVEDPEEYFYFVGGLRNMKKDAIKAALEPYKDFFHGEVLGQKKYIRDLSKGNQKKVGIVGTLLSNNPLVILDEPFANW